MIALILISAIPMYNIVMTLYNLFTAPVISNQISKGKYKTVSVLIPARNEDINIEECISRLIIQSYSNIEIIILDDFSEDSTYSKALKLSEADDRIKVVRGKALPEGWMGKNWACEQLSEISKGEFLLFIDADVRLERNAIESSVYFMEKIDPDLLTVFPVQKTETAGEKLTVPLVNWILLSFLPVKKVYSSSNKKYAGAIGQFMLFKRESYFKSGGHAVVKNEIVEDIEFAKYLKSNNYKIYMMLSDGMISCRMYRSFKEAISGFSKNYFPASSLSAVSFILVISVIAMSNILPLFLMFEKTVYIYLVLVILTQRILVSVLSRKNILYSLLFPLQMSVFLFTGILSVKMIKSGKALWKKRKI